MGNRGAAEWVLEGSLRLKRGKNCYPLRCASPVPFGGEAKWVRGVVPTGITGPGRDTSLKVRSGGRGSLSVRSHNGNV